MFLIVLKEIAISEWEFRGKLGKGTKKYSSVKNN